MIIKHTAYLALTVICVQKTCFAFSSPYSWPANLTKVNEKGNIIHMFSSKDATCTKLRNCPELLWMQQHQNNIVQAQQLSSKVFERGLKRKRCVYEEFTSNENLSLDTAVSCPIAEKKDVNEYDDEYDADGDYDYEDGAYDDDSYTLHDNDQVRAPFDIFDPFEGKIAPTGCTGSIQVTHGAKHNPLGTLKIQRFVGTGYQNLRKLRRRTILRLSSDGDCCWQVYSRRRFQGASESIYVGYDDTPMIPARSLQQVGCARR